MPVVRIKVCDGGGQPLAKQRIKVGECDELVSNDSGMAQFLVVGDGPVDVLINEATVLSCAVADLKKDEIFTQSGSSFTRR